MAPGCSRHNRRRELGTLHSHFNFLARDLALVRLGFCSKLELRNQVQARGIDRNIWRMVVVKTQLLDDVSILTGTRSVRTHGVLGRP